MPHSIRPGDVLAGRYRLVDLLTESEGGLFWRAHDRVLERRVAVHVIDAEDPRAEGLLEAARGSATVHDRRLLRVLDADRADGLCYVVNEWGSGTSLDIMLANNGPLSPRRAAWVVAEVADSIAVAHAAGVAHGRLAPENVLIDRTGAVKVIGFSVEAALRGLAPGRMSIDVSDLAALLYCALTGKWPGVSASAVDRAPQEHGRVLRPRQVRAGIPRPLDSLCDEVLNPYAVGRGREDRDLTTARGIADVLGEFVGDSTGMAEAMAASNPGARGDETVRLSPMPEFPAPPSAAAEPVAEPVAEEAPERAAAEMPAAPQAPDLSVELPTQAGLPIFDDETDDVSWLEKRASPPPPPPPFEKHPERPLFAPAPAEGSPARRPRPDSAAQRGVGFWPWDTGTGTGTGTHGVRTTGTGLSAFVEDEEEVPGRNFLRLALALGAGLLLLVAIVVAVNLGRGKTMLGSEPDGDGTTSPKPTATASASAVPLTGLVASDFDPQATPPEENPELAALAVDGDPTTTWRTETYRQDLGPGGLKTGVGLVIDLGAEHEVSALDLSLVGLVTDVALYVTTTAPEGVRDLTPVATLSAGPDERVTLEEPVTGRFLTVWLTSLPQVEGGFRGEVADVAVFEASGEASGA